MKYRVKLPSGPMSDSRLVTRHNMKPSHRKESSFYHELSLIEAAGVSPYGRAKVRACVRLYGPGSTVYAVAWVWSNDYSLSGSGSAGGGGYHKASAAMASAFEAAGIRIEYQEGKGEKYRPGGLDGLGDSCMDSAMLALAKALKVKKPVIHRAHA